MTAIFAVWNNYGFSLASDSNQTGSKDNQTWVDPVEKIIMLEKHQIAIGGAGNSFHSGVEVNEIFRTWEKSLPEEGFAVLEDYFEDFAIWYSKQTFLENSKDYENLERLFKLCFERISNVLSENKLEKLDSEIEKKIISTYNAHRDILNFLGPNWELFSSILDSEEEKLTQAEIKTDELREKIVSKVPQIESFNLMFDSDDELDSTIVSGMKMAFTEVFQRDFDFESDLDLDILNLSVSIISNLSFPTSENLEILMIGFGRDEWLPAGISFKLFSSFFGQLRMKVTDYSNPNINWYMSIAIDVAILELTRGISADRQQEIVEMAEEFLDESLFHQFVQKIDEQSTAKFHKTLARIDFLTIDRLEFVSRLFVQIEALKSFLDQPVPGVGGDTKVITMTKTTRRQKSFKEFE